MQIPKKHFPTVGLIGLVLVAAAGGSIFYYQFVLSPSAKCTLPPVHRLIFMTAIIHERGGFSVDNAAVLTQGLPKFSNVTGPNLANTTYTNYKTADNSTIQGNPGDIITLYIKSISTNDTGSPPKQDPSARGHGFTIDTDVGTVNGTITDDNIVFGTWYTVTIQMPTNFVTSTYHCTQFCSAEHPSMRGGFSVGCS